MKSRFYKYGDLIIDNIEGGYYSPVRHYNSAMGQSGETMFGMDRRWGGAVVNDSKPGKEFWSIIDKESATWPYNYKGGSNAKKLRNLACEIMWISYDKYFHQYLSKKAQRIVSRSPRLEAHFFYACWNGVVRFQQFADAINKAVDSGVTSLSKLEEVALNSRLTHSVALLRRGGEIFRDKIFSKLKRRRVPVWPFVVGGTLLLAGGTIWAVKKGKISFKHKKRR